MFLHRFRAFDAEQRERANQFAQCDGGRGKKECFSGWVTLSQNVMVVVEVGELLRKLEGVLGEIGRLGGGDALVENEGETAGAEPESPDVLVGVAGEEACEIRSVRG